MRAKQTSFRIKALAATTVGVAMTGGLVIGVVGANAKLGRAEAVRSQRAAIDPDVDAHVVAASSEEAGRYLVRVAGCNDCHTPGFMERGEAVPESEWLIGSALGFKGPWGTSYAANLRAKVHAMPEETWVAGVKSITGRPPMPWPSVHAMADSDLRNIYRYVKSLGPSDNPIPAALPPGRTPTTPYLVFEPVFPGK